jgi:hypothetical protein
MCMYKAGFILSMELIVIAAGFYFLYLAEKNNYKHLKIGGYILAVGGILIALTTTVVTIKHMTCGKHQCRVGHHGPGPGPGGWEGKRPYGEGGEKEEMEEDKE